MDSFPFSRALFLAPSTRSEPQFLTGSLDLHNRFRPSGGSDCLLVFDLQATSDFPSDFEEFLEPSAS